MSRWRDIKKGKVKKKEFNKIKYADIKDRLKAFLTDTFMITMPILYIVIYLIMGSREEFKANMSEGWIYIIISHFLIVVSFWTLKGQTPGMKAYNIKIVDKNKNIPNIIKLIIRYILMQISIIFLFGLIISFFRKDKQTLHDILSSTYTIKIDE